jgi:hypothetical protein
MTKKILIGLVFAAFAVGGVFAQTDEMDATMDFQTGVQSDEQTDAQINEPADKPSKSFTMPKNTITVDLGPTIVGVGIGVAGNALSSGDGIKTSGSFGIGAQYERQLLPKLSVGARFAYLGSSLGYNNVQKDSDSQSGVSTTGTLTTDLSVRFSSFSLEGHARYYPFNETFFLFGMLGYARFTTAFSGKAVAEVEASGYGTIKKEAVDVSFPASRNYFKLGGKLGWRITFGKNPRGGFVFEPAFGYYAGFSGSETIGTQLAKGISKAAGVDQDSEDIVKVLDPAFLLLENFIFVGGPRLSLNFGWRF